MAFMQAEMTEKQWWYSVDGPQGVEWIPEELTGYVRLSNRERGAEPVPDALADYCDNRTAYQIDRVLGYGVRSSAPGYMDCTPWTVYCSLREAKKAYNEEKRGNE